MTGNLVPADTAKNAVLKSLAFYVRDGLAIGLSDGTIQQVHNPCIFRRMMEPKSMKTIPLILLLLLACAGVMAQRQTTPATTPQRQVLFDFRTARPVSARKISPITERNVLSKVFRKYLTDSSKCNADFDASGSNDPLQAARKAGQIVPTIVDMVTGSFTGRGLTQTAYAISVSECNASHADNFGTKRVAIFSGQQLVADLDVDFRGTIVRKTDLNGDGIDELLMASGDMAQGTLTEMAALLEFQNGRLHVIEDFGTVTLDSCASEQRGSTSKASVISYADVLPGMKPKLRVENYVAGCGRGRKWRFLSIGKMPE